MENITDIVAKNLRELREQRKIKQDELAEQLSIGQSTLSSYERGTRSVPLDMLATFAKYYNVSTDYLMGLSLVQSPKEDEQYIGRYTGLSGDAIDYLHSLNEDKTIHSPSFPITRIDLINSLFDSDNDIREAFDDVLQQIILYLITCTKLFPIQEKQIAENINSIYPAFFYLEFNDLMTEIELHKNRITQSIEKLVSDTKLAVVFDFDTGKYVDFQSAMNSECGEFTSIDEIIKNNRAIFKKYEFDIWQNYDFTQARIMLYEDKIKTLKELHQNAGW